MDLEKWKKWKTSWHDMIYVVPAVILALAVGVGIYRNPFVLPEEVMASVPADTERAAEQPDKQSQSSVSSADSEKTKAKKTTFQKQGQWKDGIYTGSGAGFGGTIRVEVTISDGKMIKIDDVSHAGETPSYYKRASAIIPEILKAQTPNVDTVSGATYSSSGIREAVINALNKAGAKISESVKTNSVQNPDTGKASKPSVKKTVSGQPADGTYTGSAQCEKFDYTITLSVRFKNGKTMSISNLKVTGNEDAANEIYYQKAWRPTVKRILQKQGTEVDAVSGATYSSHAIVAAYQDAYQKAVRKNSKSKGEKERTENRSPGAGTSKTISSDETVPSGTAQDGTYSVSAVCEPDEDLDFAAYTLYADVTFAGGKCTAIANFSSTDESNKSYYTKAAAGTVKYAGVVKQILERQSASDITAVSGATCSSKTIRSLYLQALTKATGIRQPEEGTISQPTSVPQETPAVPSVTESPEPTERPANLPVRDGAYPVSAVVAAGNGAFDDYEITADVIFQEGRFAGMENMTENTNAINKTYCTKAANGTTKKKGVIPQLVEKQSSVVDVVSGATYSSLALIELYEKALVLAQTPETGEGQSE